MNNNLIDRLIDKYGYNEPIFVDEILKLWGEYSRARVFQLISLFIKQGKLNKFDRGVYYFPSRTLLGLSMLDPEKVLKKKYIQNNEDIFGFYTGMTLKNLIGLTNQVPYTIEIMTNKETTRVRKVKVGQTQVLLRRARTTISQDNVGSLQILEILNTISLPITDRQKKIIKDFFFAQGLSMDSVMKQICFFPKSTLEKLNSLGVKNVFA